MGSRAQDYTLAILLVFTPMLFLFQNCSQTAILDTEAEQLNSKFRDAQIFSTITGGGEYWAGDEAFDGVSASCDFAESPFSNTRFLIALNTEQGASKLRLEYGETFDRSSPDYHYSDITVFDRRFSDDNGTSKFLELMIDRLFLYIEVPNDIQRGEPFAYHDLPGYTLVDLDGYLVQTRVRCDVSSSQIN